MPDLTGEETLQQSREELWRRLFDFDYVARMLPGLESVTSIGGDRMVCCVRPVDLPIPLGSVDLTIERSDMDEPESLVMSVVGRAVGSSATVVTRIHLSEIPGGTNVSWETSIEHVTGLLRIARAEGFRGVVEQVIDSVRLNVRNDLSGSAEPADS